MAKRRTVVKHETDEIQGEDSYVVLSALKVKEIRNLRQVGKDERVKARAWAKKQSKLRGVDVDESEYEGADPFEGGLEILSKHILDWNWVDDEDNPLPLPKDDPDVLGELTNDETDFLSDLMTGDQERKN